MSTPIETERKFLIKMPDTSLLVSQKNLKIKQIEQTYLQSENDTNARVRRISENEKEYFVKTVKKRISTLSCYEDEYEIDEFTYSEELTKADKSKNTIFKTRYAFEYGEHIVEIDVYPFWSDRAILEIELSKEDENFEIPVFIDVLKEVSEDKRYKNTNLAEKIPYDKI